MSHKSHNGERAVSDQREPEFETVRLSEDVAHRVLARAIELEQDRGAETTVAELRAVALEAGISMQAFEAALREGTAQVGRAKAAERPAKGGGFFGRLWSRLTQRGPKAMTLFEAVIANLTAAVLFLLLMFFLSRFARPLGWQAVEVKILVSCVLGLALARALRARLVAMGLLGLVACQAGAMAMHLRYGYETVQGGPTYGALMIAGVLGAVLGWRFGSELTGHAPTFIPETPTTDVSDDRVPSRSSESRSSAHLFGLRLGATTRTS